MKVKFKRELQMKQMLILTVLLTVTLNAFSDDGHRIRIHFEGQKESECYLAYHYGNRQYLKDTAYINQKGVAVFEGENMLQAGIYLVVLSDQRNMEVIIDQNQHFDIHADPDDFTGSATFQGSPENEAFYNYLDFLRKKNSQRQEIEQKLRSPDIAEEFRQQLQADLQQMDEKVKEEQDRLIANNPEGLLARVLLAQRDPDLPDPPQNKDGSYNREEMYRVYTEKYFDNIDFSDSRLLYTPAYHSKLRLFFNNVLIQHPDSVKKAADRVLEKSRANEDMFQYTLWFLTNHAEQSQLMGMDALFVHLVDDYYSTGDAPWVNDERLNRLSQRAEDLRPLLLGKVAPDIEVFNTDGQAVTLHDTEADYLVLYFWESDCPYCKQALPKLKEALAELETSDQEVVVFAVNTEVNRERWLNALEDYPKDWVHANDTEDKSGFRDKFDIYSIPKIFILDRNKKIRAKQIGAEQVGNFIRQDMQASRGR